MCPVTGGNGYGSVNLFGWVAPLTGKRDVWATERRCVALLRKTATDYAHALNVSQPRFLRQT